MMTANTLAATAEDTTGPYYPIAFLNADRHDLSRWDGLSVGPEGDVITLTGTVRDMDGRPVAPVLVEYWQADPAGRYPDGRHAPPAWFEGAGRQYCTDGVYRLTTVRPGGGGRAAHVTLTIFCDGISRVVTQVFLPDDPALDHDPLLASVPAELRDRLVAVRDAEAEGAVYRRDIVLRGDSETPFFDDMAD